MIFLFVKKLLYQYKIYIIIGGILLLSLGFVATHGKTNKNPVVVDALELENEVKEDNNLETYNIDIKGAVKRPGVYKIVKGSIINDVIEIAGGLKSTAYTNNINLSKKVTDEMVIYIYTKSEYSNLNKTNNQVVQKDCNISTNSTDISSCVKEGASIVNSTSSEVSNQDNSSGNLDDSSVENKLININTASKEELMTLNGIGESKALCIIEYRSQNGGFKTIEEIMNISGIGEASFAKIKDYITI